MKSDS